MFRHVKVKFSDHLKIELIGIQKHFNAIHSDIYSSLAACYQIILSIHLNEIQAHKDRLEEIMDLTDKKEG